MGHCLDFLCLLGSFLHAFAQCTVLASEFRLEGYYVIGGLFDIHHATDPVHNDRPEAISCSR